jgi:ABC-type uncharacterized transport system auxiliary subunit
MTEDAMTTKHLMAYVTFTVLLMSGCAGKVRYPTYYTLAVAPIQKPAANDAHQSATVAVRCFETAGYLRQGRIVYRRTPEEIGFYDYHRWAADPGFVISTGLIDSLRSTNLFSVVEPYDGQEHPDYVVSGRLERLDEVDYGNHVQVEVKLSAQLVNVRTGASVWAGAVAQTSKVSTRDMSSIVVAMNRAVQSGIDELVANMEKQLSKTAVATQTSGMAAPGAKEK